MNIDTPRTTRRRLVAGTGAALAAVLLPSARPAGAATPATVDAEQRMCRMVGGGSGIFYAVRADGDLHWWRHLGWSTGAATWANGGLPRLIGNGWNGFVEILGGTDGSLFGVYANGDVMYYRYVLTNSTTGAGSWANGGLGVRVGTGFDRFPRMFGGPGGVIFGVDVNGDLYRSQYTAGALTTPAKVGTGFQETKWLAADTGGIIYGVRYGALVWWKLTANGTVFGGRDGGITIGDSGFGELLRRCMFTGAGGLLYFIRPDTGQVPLHDDTLVWMYLTNYQSVDVNGGPRWANGGLGKVIGNGFTVERWAPLQGYANPMTVAAGATVGIAASTTFPTVTASVVQVAPGTGTPVTVWGPQDVPGALQPVPVGYRGNGCGWTNLLQVPVDVAWPSGVYAARLVGSHGYRRDVPFVVRPATPGTGLAVILPTNTYNGYNGWGGHDQYSPNMNGAPRTFSLQRPSYSMNIEPQGMLDCDLYSDLLLLRWLSGQQVPFHCYTDIDVQRSSSWLFSYNAVILASHPEYVTVEMRQALADFIASGGRLLCTGGNAIYEPVTMSADLSATTFRAPDGNRHPYISSGLPESQLLGTNYTASGWMTFAPYQVVNDHPILAGTGLTVGSVFGTNGFLHAASGLEFGVVDGVIGSAKPAEVIAQGQNPIPGGGAAMVFMQRPNGGFVFNASSISFNGSLLSDSALSAVFRNVVNMALAPNPLRVARRAAALTPVPGIPSTGPVQENANP